MLVLVSFWLIFCSVWDWSVCFEVVSSYVHPFSQVWCCQNQNLDSKFQIAIWNFESRLEVFPAIFEIWFDDCVEDALCTNAMGLVSRVLSQFGPENDLLRSRYMCVSSRLLRFEPSLGFQLSPNFGDKVSEVWSKSGMNIKPKWVRKDQIAIWNFESRLEISALIFFWDFPCSFIQFSHSLLCNNINQEESKTQQI